jgi:folate-dependent phosphoribosylglycinamide formyltransferase PurN
VSGQAGKDRLPAAILMSGTGSNARRLLELPDPCFEVRLILTDNSASNAARIAREHGVECALLDIREFCSRSVAYEPSRSVAYSPAVQGVRDPARRAAYDREVGRLLARHGARLVALAGWDWVVGPELCRAFLFVNVHPGDLRVTDERGRRKYVGLGWIPTAKAILAGERFVHSSTHLVTPELDGGPIARVSPPVPVELPPGVTAANILPQGAGLGDVIRDINYNEGRRFGEALLYTHSRMLQEKLKELGDWVEFPATVQRLAELLLAGRLVVDARGTVRLDGNPPGDLFLMQG